MAYRRNQGPLLWAEAVDLLERAERMQRQFFRLAAGEARPRWEPPVDVHSRGEEILVEVALPGVPGDRVELVLAPGELVVRGERRLPAHWSAAAIHRLEIPYGRSFILDAVNVIFPYLANELGLSIWDVWSSIGKSKLKELTPVLKALITGEASDTQTTALAVQRMLQETLDGMEISDLYSEQFNIANDDRFPQEERQEAQQTLRAEAARMATQQLVDLARDLPTEELRRHLRPNGTQPIDFYEIDLGGRRLLAAELDDGQVDMLRNRMRERVVVNALSLPNDPQAPQAEPLRIPFLRRIAGMLRGS